MALKDFIAGALLVTTAVSAVVLLALPKRPAPPASLAASPATLELQGARPLVVAPGGGELEVRLIGEEASDPPALFVDGSALPALTTGHGTARIQLPPSAPGLHLLEWRTAAGSPSGFASYLQAPAEGDGSGECAARVVLPQRLLDDPERASGGDLASALEPRIGQWIAGRIAAAESQVELLPPLRGVRLTIRIADGGLAGTVVTDFGDHRSLELRAVLSMKAAGDRVALSLASLQAEVSEALSEHLRARSDDGRDEVDLPRRGCLFGGFGECFAAEVIAPDPEAVLEESLRELGKQLRRHLESEVLSQLEDALRLPVLTVGAERLAFEFCGPLRFESRRLVEIGLKVAPRSTDAPGAAEGADRPERFEAPSAARDRAFDESRRAIDLDLSPALLNRLLVALWSGAAASGRSAAAGGTIGALLVEEVVRAAVERETGIRLRGVRLALPPVVHVPIGDGRGRMAELRFGELRFALQRPAHTKPVRWWEILRRPEPAPPALLHAVAHGRLAMRSLSLEQQVLRAQLELEELGVGCLVAPLAADGYERREPCPDEVTALVRTGFKSLLEPTSRVTGLEKQLGNRVVAALSGLRLEEGDWPRLSVRVDFRADP